MSIETLVQQANQSSTPFNKESFDEVVMSTYGRFPIALEKGDGCRLWDTEGKEYLDFVAGIATCTLGHAHPALIEAVTQQIQKIHHVSNLYYIPEQGELARWIV
ncbi:MAG: aminotransferase class III-fold pyridoxal phosphate-dependent enzyme, partial [Rivularia sp. (in: cyanobacteria)]